MNKRVVYGTVYGINGEEFNNTFYSLAITLNRFVDLNKGDNDFFEKVIFTRKNLLDEELIIELKAMGIVIFDMADAISEFKCKWGDKEFKDDRIGILISYLFPKYYSFDSDDDIKSITFIENDLILLSPFTICYPESEYIVIHSQNALQDRKTNIGTNRMNLWGIDSKYSVYNTSQCIWTISASENKYIEFSDIVTSNYIKWSEEKLFNIENPGDYWNNFGIQISISSILSDIKFFQNKDINFITDFVNKEISKYKNLHRNNFFSRKEISFTPTTVNFIAGAFDGNERYSIKENYKYKKFISLKKILKKYYFGLISKNTKQFGNLVNLNKFLSNLKEFIIYEEKQIKLIRKEIMEKENE